MAVASKGGKALEISSVHPFNFNRPEYPMEHTIREIVCNGDTFEFAKMIEEEQYDLSRGDSVYSSLLHVCPSSLTFLIG